MSCAEVPLTLTKTNEETLSITPCSKPEITLNTVSEKLAKIMTEFSQSTSLLELSQEQLDLQDTYKIKTRVNINLEDYIVRIQKYTRFPDEIFVAALLLFNRAVTCRPELKDPSCVHKLMCGCITLASKTTDEDDYYMSDLAKIYGIDLEMLLNMEKVLFFDVLSCGVHITDVQYREFVSVLAC